MDHLKTISVAAVTGVLAVLSGIASAGSISFHEDFTSHQGDQGSASGPMADYPWTLYVRQNPGKSSKASVDAAGRLTLFSDGQGAAQAYVFASTITGQSSFDVSANPLTVSGTVGGNGPAGEFNVALLVGDRTFLFHPNYNVNDLQGCHRIGKDQGTTLLGNTKLGFVPALDTLYMVSVTVSQDIDPDKYKIDYSIGTFTNTLTVAKSTFGPLNKAGFHISAGSAGATGFFDDFSIVQGVSEVPEPSSLAIALCLSAAGVLGFSRRQRS